MDATEQHEHRAQRRRLYRLLAGLLALCIVPLALAQLSEVRPSTLAAPLIAIELLVVLAGVARYRHALSAQVAFALFSFAAAVTLAAAGEAALELGATLDEPPPWTWLSKSVCKQDGSYLLLLCPFAFALDIIMPIFYGLAYVAYALGWLLEHVGAPIMFALAFVSLLAGCTALLRARRERNPSR